MLLRTSPAVRLLAPSTVTGGRWLAEHILERTRYAIPEPAAFLLVSAFEAAERSEQIERLAVTCGVDGRVGEKLVDGLVARRLLGDPSEQIADPELRWASAVRRSWAAHGWEEAAEYHVYSYDYQFLDYATDGAEAAQSKMEAYGSAEPDLDRQKRYPADRVRDVVPLPAPRPELLPEPLEWDGPGRPRTVDWEGLAALLSISFAKVGEMRLPTRGSAPVLRRTSPSGGGRHPTEAYLVLPEALGPARVGWYHVRVDPPGLELLDSQPVDPSTLAALFPGAYGRAPFPVRALVFLTCIFRRNMYRYREPRTFRTVHMDAGHLAGTASLVAVNLGYRAFVHYGSDHAAIERQLGIDPLEEGVMLSVAIGDQEAR